MRQAPGDPVVAISAQNDEARKAGAAGALGEPDAVLERVLEREERHDSFADSVLAEVRDEVLEVLLLGCSVACLRRRVC